MRIGFDITQGTELIEAAFYEPFLVVLSPEQWLRVEDGSVTCAFSEEKRTLESISFRCHLQADQAQKIMLAKQEAGATPFAFVPSQSVEMVLEASKENFSSSQCAALLQAEMPEELLDVLNEEGFPLLLDMRHYQVSACFQQTVDTL
ncbi:MAG: hypothetical protein H6728_14975 [Myxococcales bacterium]|nr:hypothetical protein [Myxococcales bacterium]MCB9644373.1 hypothetical protein [Myxococcales bacterium]